MRVIAGSLGGRSFAAPHGRSTHPMSERVRGALFNVLGDMQDVRVLDAFAGSGALSFEAASRGAGQIIAIEVDRAAQKTIEENIATLALASKVKLIKASAGAWLRTNPDAKFDVVLCDPPYDNVQQNLLVELGQRVASGGVIVLSLPPKATIALPTGDFELLTTKNYGDAQLLFFVRA